MRIWYVTYERCESNTHRLENQSEHGVRDIE